jgi:hypothetical protein
VFPEIPDDLYSHELCQCVAIGQGELPVVFPAEHLVPDEQRNTRLTTVCGPHGASARRTKMNRVCRESGPPCKHVIPPENSRMNAKNSNPQWYCSQLINCRGLTYRVICIVLGRQAVRISLRCRMPRNICHRLFN